MLQPAGTHPYDRIAPVYDALHATQKAVDENFEIMNRVAYSGGSVLDIGCGTGLFLDYAAPIHYLGIDPSAGMLRRMLEKHPGANVLKTTFEGFQTIDRYDLVVSLFGAASYVPVDALERIPAMLTRGGRFFVMIYKRGYYPETYAGSGVEVPHFDHSENVLNGVVSEFGNFWVIEGKR